MDEALFLPNIANKGKMLYHDGEKAVWVTPNIPQGTVTEIRLAVPEEFRVTSDPVKNSGTLAFESKSAAPGMFMATPADASGKMNLRPLSSSDLPIVDVEHGGTGRTESFKDNALIVATDGKFASGPKGTGFVYQSEKGIEVKPIDLSLTVGKITFDQISGGAGVPSSEGAMSKILSNNGIRPVWVERPKPPTEKLYPVKTASGYSLDLPKMSEGDELELTMFFLVLQTQAEMVPVIWAIQIGNYKMQWSLTLAREDTPAVQNATLKLFRTADKIVYDLSIGGRGMTTLDFGAANQVTFSLTAAEPTANISITPLLAKALLF